MFSGQSHSRQAIQWAQYRDAGLVQYMSVNHGSGDIRMPQEFLHRSDVIARFEQMRREGISVDRRNRYQIHADEYIPSAASRSRIADLPSNVA